MTLKDNSASSLADNKYHSIWIKRPSRNEQVETISQWWFHFCQKFMKVRMETEIFFVCNSWLTISVQISSLEVLYIGFRRWLLLFVKTLEPNEPGNFSSNLFHCWCCRLKIYLPCPIKLLKRQLRIVWKIPPQLLKVLRLHSSLTLFLVNFV